jgi:hypothetical protein
LTGRRGANPANKINFYSNENTSQFTQGVFTAVYHAAIHGRKTLFCPLKIPRLSADRADRAGRTAILLESFGGDYAALHGESFILNNAFMRAFADLNNYPAFLP